MSGPLIVDPSKAPTLTLSDDHTSCPTDGIGPSKSSTCVDPRTEFRFFTKLDTLWRYKANRVMSREYDIDFDSFRLQISILLLTYGGVHGVNQKELFHHYCDAYGELFPGVPWLMQYDRFKLLLIDLCNDILLLDSTDGDWLSTFDNRVSLIIPSRQLLRHCGLLDEFAPDVRRRSKSMSRPVDESDVLPKRRERTTTLSGGVKKGAGSDAREAPKDSAHSTHQASLVDEIRQTEATTSVEPAIKERELPPPFITSPQSAAVSRSTSSFSGSYCMPNGCVSGTVWDSRMTSHVIAQCAIPVVSELGVSQTPPPIQHGDGVPNDAALSETKTVVAAVHLKDENPEAIDFDESKSRLATLHSLSPNCEHQRSFPLQAVAEEHKPVDGVLETGHEHPMLSILESGSRFDTSGSDSTRSDVTCNGTFLTFLTNSTMHHVLRDIDADNGAASDAHEKNFKHDCRDAYLSMIQTPSPSSKGAAIRRHSFAAKRAKDEAHEGVPLFTVDEVLPKSTNQECASTVDKAPENDSQSSIIDDFSYDLSGGGYKLGRDIKAERARARELLDAMKASVGGANEEGFDVETDCGNMVMPQFSSPNNERFRETVKVVFSGQADDAEGLVRRSPSPIPKTDPSPQVARGASYEGAQQVAETSEATKVDDDVCKTDAAEQSVDESDADSTNLVLRRVYAREQKLIHAEKRGFVPSRAGPLA